MYFKFELDFACAYEVVYEGKTMGMYEVDGYLKDGTIVYMRKRKVAKVLTTLEKLKKQFVKIKAESVLTLQNVDNGKLIYIYQGVDGYNNDVVVLGAPAEQPYQRFYSKNVVDIILVDEVIKIHVDNNWYEKYCTF